MAAPLRSENPGEHKSMQFAHFGVLNAGAQSRTSALTSLAINLSVAFVLIVLTAATKKTIEKNRLLTELVAPVPVKKVEPVKPKIVPPKPKPLPQIPQVEPPKIVEVKLPELPKQPIVKMENPKPVIVPPAPQKIIAPAAPVAVSLAVKPQAASVVNNDAHPTAVRLGNSTSPLNDLHGPSVASVNLAQGMPGMNAANTGNGPRATQVNMGNGSPESTVTRGNGVQEVAGIPHGVPGATGHGPAGGSQQVSLGQTLQPAPARPAVVQTAAAVKVPTVIEKPKPQYTSEAIQNHIEGIVTLRIRVLPDGQVEVVAVTKPLGYGLDDSARRAILATKFHPATDATGTPVAWEGVVNVTFQLAG